VRAGVSWDSVLRIDGMVKLMLELHGMSYLPIESVSMQERVRAVEFVLGRCGLERARSTPPVRRPTATNAGPELRAPRVESWPYALVDRGDHEA
jgi:hypothetical protein